jgi:hypothetical protein
MTESNFLTLWSRVALIAIISLITIHGLGTFFQAVRAADLEKQTIASSPTGSLKGLSDGSQPADAALKSMPPILQLTNTETAAMIAAENAALTPPQVLVNLPLVFRP